MTRRITIRSANAPGLEVAEAVARLLLAIHGAGCATTQHKHYEGRNAVVEGKGGTREVVDGMDIWDNGDPPRRYQIVGVIEDERAAGIIGNAMLKGDLVKKAREAGGDAIVRVSSDSRIAGFVTTGKRVMVTKAVQQNQVVFAVIRYVQ